MRSLGVGLLQKVPLQLGLSPPGEMVHRGLLHALREAVMYLPSTRTPSKDALLPLRCKGLRQPPC